jgi:hypothetical protein
MAGRRRMTLGHGRRTRRTAGEDFDAMNDDDASATVAMTGQATGTQDARDGRAGHEGESRRAHRAGRAGRPRRAAALARRAGPPRWQRVAPQAALTASRAAPRTAGDLPEAVGRALPMGACCRGRRSREECGDGDAGGESAVGLAATPCRGRGRGSARRARGYNGAHGRCAGLPGTRPWRHGWTRGTRGWGRAAPGSRAGAARSLEPRICAGAAPAPEPRACARATPAPRAGEGARRRDRRGGLEGPTSTAATAPGSAGAMWARTRAGRFGRRKRRWAPLTGGPGGWGGLGRARLRVWGGAAARWWAAGWAAGVRDAGGSGGGSRALDGPGKPLGWRAGGKGGAGWAFFCFSFLFLDLLFFPILSTISNRISY